jgi:outer membrane protein
VPEFDRTLISGHLSAAWVLYDGGGRSARIARAESGESVADEGVRAAESELIAATSRAFLAVLDARAAERALTGQIEALESERTRNVRLETEGRVAHVEVLRVDAGLARSLADMAASRAGVARDEAELARLLGSTPTAVGALALATPDPAEPSVPDRTALIAAAHRDNADIARAELRLAAAEAGRRNARSDLIPTVALAGRYNAFGSGAGDFDVEWQGGLQLSWPVFTGGQRGARVAEADAEVALARQDLRLAQLRVESAVDAALAALAETSARTEALDAAVIQFEAVVGVEQLALDAGAGVQTDFLSARAALLESQMAAFQARHAAIAARIAVARATGQLTLDWIDTELGRSR